MNKVVVVVVVVVVVEGDRYVTDLVSLLSPGLAMSDPLLESQQNQMKIGSHCWEM